jgi:hypothetical protein
MQIVDLLASSLRKHFDCAIGVVAHPTGDAENVCLPLHEPAEADTLDAAANEKSASLNAFA